MPAGSKLSSRAKQQPFQLLTHAGRYQWREFNNVFIEHISRAGQIGDSSTYYQRWLAALEQLALQKGFVSADELQELSTLLAAEDNHH